MQQQAAVARCVWVTEPAALAESTGHGGVDRGLERPGLERPSEPLACR
jgi:hypothetical protein